MANPPIKVTVRSGIEVKLGTGPQGPGGINTPGVIHAADAVTNPDLSSELPLVVNVSSVWSLRKITLTALKTLVQDWASGGSVAGGIHDATGKTPPADADELALVDSADGFSLKKLTWANLKATVLAGISKSLGGNGAADSTKVAEFNTDGSLRALSFITLGAATENFVWLDPNAAGDSGALAIGNSAGHQASFKASFLTGDWDYQLPDRIGVFALLDNITRPRMAVTGTLSPDATGPLIYAGTRNGFDQWTTDGLGTDLAFASHPGSYDAVWHDTTSWHVSRYTSSGAPAFSAFCISSAASPAGLSFTTVVGTGTATVAAAYSASVASPSGAIAHTDVSGLGSAATANSGDFAAAAKFIAGAGALTGPASPLTIGDAAGKTVSAGGAGATDSGKVPVFGTNGELKAAGLDMRNASGGGLDFGFTGLGIGYSLGSAVSTLAFPPIPSGSFDIVLPSASGTVALTSDIPDVSALGTALQPTNPTIIYGIVFSSGGAFTQLLSVPTLTEYGNAWVLPKNDGTLAISPHEDGTLLPGDVGAAAAAKFIAGAGALTGPAAPLTIGTIASAASGDYATSAKFIAGAGALTGPAAPLTIGTAAGAATTDFAAAADFRTIQAIALMGL
jgi:hypothetical protein